VNKNLIPYDERKSVETSGIRIGTAALTTRGLEEDHMRLIGEGIEQVLRSGGEGPAIEQVRHLSEELCREFPIPA